MLKLATPYDYGLNQSQFTTYQRCRYLWHLEYERRIVRRFDGVPISLGTAVHKGVAAGLSGQSWEQAIDKWGGETLALGPSHDEEVVLADVMTSAMAITQRTLQNLDIGHRWDTYVHDGVPLVEFTFEIPLTGWGNWKKFHGTVDWVAVDIETGRNWLTDHKVRGSFMAELAEEYNVQMAVYKHLMNERGIINVFGSMMHQIKSAVPKEPKVNKDGKISRAAVLTDWPTYKQTCIDWGQDPDDYLDMKTKLQDAEWFRMTQNYWPDEMVASIWENVKRGAKAIGKEDMPRSIGFMNCNTCRLKDYCFGEMRGDDLDFLMKTQYKHKDEISTPLPTELEE